MTTLQMTYAVRCCCQPTKILGYLDGPIGISEFEIPEQIFAPYSISSNTDLTDTVKTTKFVVRSYGNSPLETERAIYSEDRPIEFWRNVPGFRESQEMVTS